MDLLDSGRPPFPPPRHHSPTSLPNRFDASHGGAAAFDSSEPYHEVRFDPSRAERQSPLPQSDRHSNYSAQRKPGFLHSTENQSPIQHGDREGGATERVDQPHIEAIFHPELRRTKEVIKKPHWLTQAAAGEAIGSHRGKLNALALFGMLFAYCIGGGYGFEDGISAAGPLITLIVCITLPWIWCFPTGLAVAELSTSVPSNSGVLMWTNVAFPPFISFFCILGTVLMIFISNATYPNLTAEYFSNLLVLSNWQVMLVKAAVIILCCFVNCIGVEVVGAATVTLCVITITPFALLTMIQLFGHGFNKAVLHVDMKDVQWSEFFSIISWNYANIENAGTVVEEVMNPQVALPQSMAMLMLSSYVAYVIPMLAGVSAMGMNQDYSQWVTGHWPDVAQVIAGPWLKYMLFVGAIFSGVGFTVTSICCTSRLLAGLGGMKIFHSKISRFIGYYHPRLGTPIVAIVLNSMVTMAFSLSLDFGDVVALCQSFYCLRMLLIYGAVIKLRVSYPHLKRPYKLPGSTLVVALCLVPAAVFSVFAAVVSAMQTTGISIAMGCFLVGGIALSWVYCRLFARDGFHGVIVHYIDEDEVEEFHEVVGAVDGEDIGLLKRKRPSSRKSHGVEGEVDGKEDPNDWERDGSDDDDDPRTQRTRDRESGSWYSKRDRRRVHLSDGSALDGEQCLTTFSDHHFLNSVQSPVIKDVRWKPVESAVPMIRSPREGPYHLDDGAVVRQRRRGRGELRNAKEEPLSSTDDERYEEE